MWHVFITIFLLAARICFAAESDQKPTKPYTEKDIDVLVNTFTSFRNDETLQEFAEAVGDMSLLDKKRPDERFNFVKMYLNNKDERFFDAVRKTYLFCSKPGKEHLMSQLKDFLEKHACIESVEKLFHCLPYTSDFRKEEQGLVEMLGEIWASCNQSSFDIWQANPVELQSIRYWRTKGPREGKKYFLAMLKYEFVSATHEKRVELLRKAANSLCMGDLLELQSFLRERFGTKYSLGDIDRLLIGPKILSPTDQVSQYLSVISGWFIKSQHFPFDQIPQDIWRQVILCLDWRTIMYSMRYVNKSLYKYTTETRISSDCPDFQKLLCEQPRDGSPERFYIFDRPWNAIFPTYPKFLTHYILGNEPNLGFRAFAHIIRVYFAEHELLHSKTSSLVGDHFSGFSFDDLARIFEYLVKAKSIQLPSLFEDIPNDLIVLLMGKMKDTRCLTRTFNGDYAYVIGDEFYCAVLRAAFLDWPEDLIKAVENAISKRFSVQVPLPFTADKIQKCEPEKLQSIMEKFRDPLISIKIFNALLEMDPKSMSFLTVEDFKFVLYCGLASNPAAMTPKQFGMFVKLAMELHGENEEFNNCLSNFIAEITKHK